MKAMNTKEYSDVKYRKLTTAINEDEDSEPFIKEQFESEKPNIPYGAIMLAAFLCFTGSALLIAGSLLLSGHIDVKYADRTWPLIILGVIMFLPGAYHVHIAFCAYRQYPGYSFDDIPEFE